MVLRRPWRAPAPLVLVALLGLAACAGSDGREGVVAGAPAGRGPTAASTSTSAPAVAPVTSDPSVSVVPSTVVAADPAGDDPSPVPGVTAAELAAAVAAPIGGVTRSVGGPTLDRVPVGSATGWRVRVPSDAPVRSARVEVLVGDRVVGQAVPSSDLTVLVAVTLDPAGLDAGAPVALRWEGADPVPAGRLAVVR